MIKDPEIPAKFEDDLMRGRERLSYEQARKLFTAMWLESLTLGVLPAADPLAGIDVDIRVARILNSCSTKSLLTKGT